MRKSLFTLITFIAVFQFIACNTNEKNKQPVDYVNPNIGTIGHLLVSTASVVQLPHGTLQLGQNPYPEIADRYLADKISSFSLRALPWYDTKTVPSWIMATVGKLKVAPNELASLFDHDFETVTPYYSSTFLEDYKIEVSNTIAEHASFYQFKFPKSDESHILIGMNSEIKITGNNSIEAKEIMPRPKGQVAYYYAEFSKSFSSTGSWKGTSIEKLNEQTGDTIGIYATFSTEDGENIGVRIGVSFIDIQQAKENLAKEIPGFNFGLVKNKAKDCWNTALGKVQVEGGTETDLVKFYSALYRTFLGNQSVNLTEYGRYFSPYDNKVHLSQGHDFYRVGSNWGSHHSLFPLFLLLEPEKQNDILRSYARIEEQGKWLSNIGTKRSMIARHEVATITDAYMKGYRDFDTTMVYEALKKNIMTNTMITHFIGSDNSPTELDRVYMEKGFFPAIPSGTKEWVAKVSPYMHRQSVSITLENCYDDWCRSILAKELGKKDDLDFFLKRAYNYQNVFDTITGFMRPKTADGKWIEPFDPIWSGGEGGRDYYTENNGWNYTFYVPHDVKGLIELMGGREKFVAKLNRLFATTVPLYDKYKFLGQFPDMTGWIGMYSHGNEIAWHIPFMYNYAGAPWMTQRRVRQIMDIWYNDGPLGICGDEDYGEMSSWYVFNAMGFYTVDPGNPIYNIGSPIFDKAKIDIGNGKKFSIEAINVSKQNKYIQSAELNGKSIDRPWFSHDELMVGGKLVLNMGPIPNKTWGCSPQSAPPSLSK